MTLATTNSRTPARYEDEGEFGTVEIVPGAAMSAAIRSEIEAQVAVAQRYKRSIKVFLDDAVSIATRSKRIAEACVYALPRGGKMINGPSVRLAEIMASCYGNMRIQTRVTEIDDRFVTVEGICLDTEKNVGVSTQVKRRITDKYGKTYNEDMIAVTTAAASAIARRNAIFAVIPNAFRDEVYEAAVELAAGNRESFGEARDNWIAHFNALGVKTDRILEVLGVRGIEDMTYDHTATLLGIENRRKDGEKLNTLFPMPEPVAPTTSKAAGLAAKLKANDAPEPGSNG